MAGMPNLLQRVLGRAPAAGPLSKRIKSWMGIFQAEVQARTVETIDELADIVRAGNYYCVGSAHSYNGIQIIRDSTAVIMNESKLLGIEYDPTTQQVTVGPSVTIRTLKERLLKHDRRLIASGNFMAQTVIGALATGTHGYGDRAVMAEGVTALTFLDGAGQPVTLKRGDRDFPYAALAFGTISPIVSLTLETEPIASFEANTVICRLSEKPAHVKPGHAVMFAVFPYSDQEDPTIALQTVGPAPPGRAAFKVASPLFSLRRISEFIIKRYWVFDRLFPALRRPFQRLIARLRLSYHHRDITDPRDLDYLYDPTPGLESSRDPDILKSLLSPTYTAYNLAFFVRLKDAPDVVRLIMYQAEHLRRLGFYLKSMIGVRELSSRSELPFAGNALGPAAAIDLFADVRDYAWLERIQREVFSYFPDVRPHWGKSAIVDELADTLTPASLAALGRLHRKHYADGQLVMPNRVRRLLGLPMTPPGAISKLPSPARRPGPAKPRAARPAERRRKSPPKS